MITHEILPEAQAEFNEAVDYLEQQVTGLGNEFRQEVVTALRKILDDPKTGSWYEDEMLYRPVQRFRYVVVYAMRREHVVVVAIMHEARRPGYWKHRLK